MAIYRKKKIKQAACFIKREEFQLQNTASKQVCIAIEMISNVAKQAASKYKTLLPGTQKAAMLQASRSLATSSGPPKTPGFDTLALHAGYEPDREAVYGLGQGAPCSVPLYRTTPFVFKNTEHAANLCSLKEMGNVYSRIGNPTTHVLESRYAQLEGGDPLSGLAVASGTNAVFYAIFNLAQRGDNIVSSTGKRLQDQNLRLLVHL
jgi:hypothetical protein